MYNAVDIGKYIVNFFSEKGSPITNLKLQKLLYFVWIGYYQATGKYLFENEICAWPLGPVVPDVYDEFCAYGGLPIRKSYDMSDFPDLQKDIIDSVLDQYFDISASRLVTMTHAEGKPWSQIFADGAGRNKKIPFDVIISGECN